MVERSAIRILVLDDESFMLKLLSRILANLGFTSVTLCDSGRGALESIDAGPGPISSCWTSICLKWMG
jgi:CheY-like chemotaxis protein